MRRAFLWLMIASLALAALLGIIAILVEGLGDIGERVLWTSLLVGAFSMICLGNAFVLERARARPTMLAGIITSLAALGVWLIFVWFDAWQWRGPWGEYLAKTGASLTTVCIWTAHLGMLILPKLEMPAWRWVRRTSLVLAAILGLSIITFFWTEYDEEWVFKWTAVLSILTACGTVVTPILALIGRLRHREAEGGESSLAARVRISLTCPRCGTMQTLAAGRSRCEKCGLRIGLEIEEPRCACGYLLFGISGDACPECGRAIPEGERWGGSGGGAD